MSVVNCMSDCSFYILPRKLMEVPKTFGEKGKIMVGYCAAGMLFDFAGITAKSKQSVRPLARSVISVGDVYKAEKTVESLFLIIPGKNQIVRAIGTVVAALK